MKLKDTTIRSTKAKEKIFKLSDGASLFLLIHPSGTKTWIYLYRFNGKQKKITFGQYPQISLGEARKLRQNARNLLDKGIDPNEEKKTIKKHTLKNSFKNISQDWFSTYKVNKAQRTISVYEHVLNFYILPAIGDMPIKDIKRIDLVNLVKDNTLLRATKDVSEYKEKRAISTSFKMCYCLGMIFNYAMNIGILEYSVANQLSSVLPDPEYSNQKTVLKHDDVKHLLQAIRMEGYATKSVWYFLNIMPYVFVRNTELRCATWEEINFERAEWHIPSARMKGKKLDKPHIPSHFVPLSKQVLELLLQLKKDSNSDYLFPAHYHKNKCITDAAPLVALKRFGFCQTVHGFRTIASTYLHELNFPTHIIESQLAHKDKNKIRSVYNKAEYKEERIKMMQSWADYLDKLTFS